MFSKLDIFDGSNWNFYATENFVNNKIFDINSNTSGQLNIDRLSSYPSNPNLFLNGMGNWIEGIPGPQGPKGDTGPQGIQGIQGIQGPIGPQGPAWDTLTLTGAVTGSGLTSINTTLNPTQYLTENKTLLFNWDKSNLDGYFLKNNVISGRLAFFNTIETNVNNDKRSWTHSYDLETNRYTIDFYRNNSNNLFGKTPLSMNYNGTDNINIILDGGNIISYCNNFNINGNFSVVGNFTIVGGIDLQNHSIGNLINTTDPLSAVNKQYADSLITAQLSALSNLSTTGLIARTAANTFATRSLAVGTGQSITNSNGVSGNPTINLSTQLQNLHNLNTLGFVSLSSTGSGNSSFVNRTLIAGSGIAVSNGNGVSGNPTISLGTVPINLLSGYPNNSAVFLNGTGSWVIPNEFYGNDIYIFALDNNTQKLKIVNYPSSSGVSFYLKPLTFEGVLMADIGYFLTLGSNGVPRITINTNGEIDCFSNNITTLGTIATKYLASSSGSLTLNSNLYCGSKDIDTYGTISARTGFLEANNIRSYNSSRIECDVLNIADSYYYGSSFGYGYLNSGGNTGTSSGNNPYSITCTNRIRASEFNAVSSIKKKNILNQGVEVEKEVVDIIQKIDFFKYEYKDKIAEKGVRYGIIAEELNKVLPDYVDMENMEYLPNIRQKGKTKLELKIEPDTYYYILELPNAVELEFETNQLKLIDAQNKVIEVEICKKINTTTFEIKAERELPYEVYVYGIYGKCPSVGNKISELSLIALKNVIKRLLILEEKSL